MKRSSTAASGDERASTGRGSRLLTGWVLECLETYGSKVEAQAEGGWQVEVGQPLIRVVGRQRLELSLAREAGQSAPGQDPLTWESGLTQRLISFVRAQGQTAELWLRGADPDEGLKLVTARLEIEGQEPRLSALATPARPRLAYNFKVRWQGSEGREELRSVAFDPGTGIAREIPPADQDDFGPAPPKRPVGLPNLPVWDGFEKARQVLHVAIVSKLNQRTQRARATASDEEARLNTYYSQLLREEQSATRRRGGRRAQERGEQLKREWRQRLEALGRGAEEVRYGLVSAAVLWVPWLTVEVSLPGRPALVRTTELDLHLRRWEGLTCDVCGRPHTWLRRVGETLVGADCGPPSEPPPSRPKSGRASR